MASESHEWVIRDVLRVREVQATIAYATNRAIEGIDCNTVGDLAKALEAFLSLPGAEPGQPRPEATRVLDLYCLITKVTYAKFEVNGLTILASEHPIRSLYWMIGWTLFFLTFVLIAQFFGPIVEVLEETYFEDPGFGRTFLGVFGDEILPYLEPLFWGGLGSCIFLLKRYNDYVADHALDVSRLPGYTARVTLGAILAVVVVNLFFDPSPAEEGASAFPWSGDAVAFLSGLGVKVVYGALEKAIDRLAEWLGK